MSTDLATFLHAIADPARRRILLALKEKAANATAKGIGLCAGDVEGRVRLSQPTVSHHMHILARAGLVEVRKQGQWRRYRRNEKKIACSIRLLKKSL